MNNTEIRQAIKDADIKYWQVAEKLDLNDGNFSRKLRKELTAEQREKVLAAITEIKAGAAYD